MALGPGHLQPPDPPRCGAEHSWMLHLGQGTPTYPLPSKQCHLLPRTSLPALSQACGFPLHLQLSLYQIFLCCCCLVQKSCPTLCDPMDCSPLDSSVHGISQARILEWVAISICRGSSWPRESNCISFIACGFFTAERPGKNHIYIVHG